MIFPYLYEIIAYEWWDPCRAYMDHWGDGNVANPGPPPGAVVEDILGLEDAVLMIDAWRNGKSLGPWGSSSTTMTGSYKLY